MAPGANQKFTVITGFQVRVRLAASVMFRFVNSKIIKPCLSKVVTGPNDREAIHLLLGYSRRSCRGKEDCSSEDEAGSDRLVSIW